MAKIGYSSDVCDHQALLNHAPTREHTEAMSIEDGSKATHGFLLTQNGVGQIFPFRLTPLLNTMFLRLNGFPFDLKVGPH